MKPLPFAAESLSSSHGSALAKENPRTACARIQAWELREVSQLATGEVSLRLCLPDSPSASLFPKFTVDYWVTIGKTLSAKLVVANISQDQDFTF